MFVDEIQNSALSEDVAAQKELDALLSNLTLRHVHGWDDSPFRTALNGATYECRENPMGITKFAFVFHDEKSGELRYTNVQGDKIIPFGVNYNVFGKFPQLGYSNERGAVATTDGFMYDDAASLAWTGEKELLLFVQIIDRYFGNMSAKFHFKDDEVYAVFSKTAENFLNEYQGGLVGRKAN
jgi:hypothetical protein